MWPIKYRGGTDSSKWNRSPMSATEIGTLSTCGQCDEPIRLYEHGEWRHVRPSGDIHSARPPAKPTTQRMNDICDLLPDIGLRADSFAGVTPEAFAEGLRCLAMFLTGDAANGLAGICSLPHKHLDGLTISLARQLCDRLQGSCKR